jgi:hypothetical protein
MLGTLTAIILYLIGISGWYWVFQEDTTVNRLQVLILAVLWPAVVFVMEVFVVIFWLFENREKTS